MGKQTGGITYYLCNRVVDYPDYNIPSVKRKCSKCGEDVWVSKRTLKKAEECMIICPHCLEKLKDVEIIPIVLPETLEELIESLMDEADVFKEEEKQIKKIRCYH